MKFTIIGSIFDTSGYSIHTRNLFNSLSKIADVKLATSLVKDFYRLVNDKELEAIKKVDDYDRIRIIITHPLYWRVNCINKRNWAFLVWEGDKLPKSFIEECLNPEIEKILVPSNHTYTALENTLDEEQAKNIMHKVVLVPHGVDSNLFYPKNETHDKFTFFCNKGWRGLEDRGGVQYALKAYIEEFRKDDPVRLIIKINPAYGIPNIDKLLSEISPRQTDIPDIHFDIGEYEYKDLNDLYNKADVFVSTTRAEAFNIPCLEAMSCGLPVLTTCEGGQTDYIEDGNQGFLVDGDMTEIKHELQYEGISWLTPSIEQIRKRMRWFVDNKEIAKTMGDSARQKALEYSWDTTAKRLLIN